MAQVEMFKIRMQGQYGGAGDKKLGRVVSDMWRDYGFRNGIMRGYWITVVREIPAYAGFYAGVYHDPHKAVKHGVKRTADPSAYETSKRIFTKRFSPDPLPVWAVLTSGGIGGLGYWLACYPLDVVKSRVQLAEAPPAKGGWS